MTTATATHTRPANADEGYRMVHDLIFDQIHKFRRRYGGDFDELTGQALVAFMRGHHQFMRGTTPTGHAIKHDYPTEIRRWVWYTMFDDMRTRLSRAAKVRVDVVGDDLNPPAPQYRFRVDEFTEALSDDARYAVGLVLDTPEDIAEVAMAKGGAPRNFRSTVRAHLATDLGWAPGRISAAFAEITEALG